MNKNVDHYTFGVKQKQKFWLFVSVLHVEARLKQIAARDFGY